MTWQYRREGRAQAILADLSEDGDTAGAPEAATASEVTALCEVLAAWPGQEEHVVVSAEREAHLFRVTVSRHASGDRGGLD